jgi:hypothetical protein
VAVPPGPGDEDDDRQEHRRRGDRKPDRPRDGVLDPDDDGDRQQRADVDEEVEPVFF